MNYSIDSKIKINDDIDLYSISIDHECGFGERLVIELSSDITEEEINKIIKDRHDCFDSVIDYSYMVKTILDNKIYYDEYNNLIEDQLEENQSEVN